MPASDGLPVSEQELQLLRELTAAGVPFMLVGLSAAVVQGADPLFSGPGLDDIRAHGRDERLAITSFYEAQDFLYRVVAGLVGAE